MKYNDIINSNKNITGVHEYSQTTDSMRENINIKGGVCRALTIMWLLSKKEGSNFWADYDRESVDETKPLIASIAKAVKLQDEYAAFTQGRYTPDPITADKLESIGAALNINDITASAQFGFAVQTPNDETQKIATKILNAKSRYFILSIKGSSGAHSIGVFRPNSVIGKSSTVSFFDPNFGEFSVSGPENVKAFLTALHKAGYDPTDLNKSYILWAYGS